MKRILLSLLFAATATCAEPTRVTATGIDGELLFIGVFDVSYKPSLKLGKPYACHVEQDFVPKLKCVQEPKGNKKVGRYCLKEKKGSDLMCSRSIFVGE